MSIWVGELADRAAALVQPITLDGRIRSQDAIERAARNYARRGAAGDLRDLLGEARRLADDIRQRTGHDHTDVEWQEIASYLHPYFAFVARETYIAQNVARLIASLAAQIDAMETELLTLAPRTA